MSVDHRDDCPKVQIPYDDWNECRCIEFDEWKEKFRPEIEAELREQIAKEIEGLLIGFVDGGTYNEGIIAAVNVARGEVPPTGVPDGYKPTSTVARWVW